MTDSPIAQLVNSHSPFLEAEESRAPKRPSVVLVYRGPLADSTEVFLIRHANGVSRAIALLSSEAAPGMVARATRKAREASMSLGSELGKSVLVATAEGEVEGRSYAITPYCRPFGSPRVRWWFERARLRRAMLDWLAGVASKTAVVASPQAVSDDFVRPLERLLGLNDLSEKLRGYAQAALQRISTGAWRPHHVLMHGDLWRGNLLLRSRSGEFANANFAKRVAVIDWAGSKTQGYAIVDLVRLASSLRLSSRQLRVEIAAHAAMLKCTDRDCIGYLLAATGCLFDELEEFPIERFTAMAEESLDTLLSALNELEPAARA